jgi:23S rRNA pseudouridine1911/1915/1917 synthase
MPQVTRIVAAADDGCRLDVYLSRQAEIGSRLRAKQIIEAGLVDVGAARVRPGLFLAAGQQVRFEPEIPGRVADAATVAPPPDLPVLFADPWLAVVDKPPGLPSHPPEGRVFSGPTVASLAQAKFGDLPRLQGEDRPGIVHRLDRDTSGVMLIGRTEEAFHFLRAQFKARTVHKEYRCIAFGESRFDSDWIERPIGVDPNHPERRTVVEAGGREASTYYEVLERFAGFTYFRCLPKTGRTHQIRVHMTSVGHSLVGDKSYRSRRAQHDALPEGAPDPGRQCLHAFRLQVPHPHTHELLEFEAPLPGDMLQLLRWLREHRPPR